MAATKSRFSGKKTRPGRSGLVQAAWGMQPAGASYVASFHNMHAWFRPHGRDLKWAIFCRPSGLMDVAAWPAVNGA